MPNNNKLGLPEAKWEGWTSVTVLGGGDWLKCSCLLTCRVVVASYKISWDCQGMAIYKLS